MARFCFIMILYNCTPPQMIEKEFLCLNLQLRMQAETLHLVQQEPAINKRPVWKVDGDGSGGAFGRILMKSDK